MGLIARWWHERSGATAVEYGVIIGVLVMLIMGGIGNAFNAVHDLLEDNNNQLVHSIE